MTTFYIDTSSSYLYTGLVENNKLLIEKKINLSRDLSIITHQIVSKMFEEVNLKPNDIDKIIVVNGPGSFTGIRIGIGLAKIFALCLKKKITTITSLEAMSVSTNRNKAVVPIIDARRGYVYAAVYCNNECLLEPQYISFDKLKLYLSGNKLDYIFVSNDSFKEERVVSYDPNILAIVLKYQDKEDINPHIVNPEYLKLTEAEENKIKECNND